MVICLERGADLRMAQLMPLPLTVSCFSKIQIGFTFLVPADPGSPGKKAVKWVCVCITCRLTAKNRDQLRNPTLGNRVYGLALPLYVDLLPVGLKCDDIGVSVGVRQDVRRRHSETCIS